MHLIARSARGVGQSLNERAFGQRAKGREARAGDALRGVPGEAATKDTQRRGDGLVELAQPLPTAVQDGDPGHDGERQPVHRPKPGGSRRRAGRADRVARSCAPSSRSVRSPAAARRGDRRSRRSASALCSVNAYARAIDIARSTNRSTASASGGTAYTSSSIAPKGIRLVAITTTSRCGRSSPVTTWAQPVATCSQLSSTSSARRSRRAFTQPAGHGIPRRWRSRDRWPASQAPSQDPSPRPGVPRTPSWKSRTDGGSERRRRASSIASRVLPSPPTPQIVISRARAQSSCNSASSRSRPTKRLR